MSLFGSLFTGVSGLNAQSQSTAIISNNIANVNTVGFKRSEAAFFALVTNSGRSTRYSPGTVATERIQRVDQQGGITQTASSTDVAVSGNGFFVVKENTDDSALDTFFYTRNGQFSEDNQGFLQNSAGFFLYGWPVDTVGEVVGGETEQNLVPVSVGFASGLARQTVNAEISLNLDAREVDDTLATAATSQPDFSRAITVYDALGTPQTLHLNYTKVYGPQGTAAGTVGSLTYTTSLTVGSPSQPGVGLTEGDQFSISIDGAGGGPASSVIYEIDSDGLVDGPVTVPAQTLVQTVGDIIDDINANVVGVSAYLGNNGEIIVQRDVNVGTAGSVDLLDENGTPLAGLGFGAGGVFAADALDGTGPSGVDYDNGTAGDPGGAFSSEDFPQFQLLDPTDSNYNSRGWWQLDILDGNNNRVTRGLINFNADGSLNAVQDSDGTIDLDIAQIDWGNGSSLQNISLDLEQIGQAASDYTVFFTDQDGAELGLRTGISIDSEGYVIAQFSNGATQQLYRVPLATFSNSNGLQEANGTAYVENDLSGPANLRLAGSGGAGSIQNSALENSNVDLADEFARLIISQRAYSANTRVINTVDQMTEDLLRLR